MKNITSKHCFFFKLYEQKYYQNTNIRGTVSQVKQEVKHFPYTPLTCPEGYMRLRLPDFQTIDT
jgi:hypothetical protein